MAQLPIQLLDLSALHVVAKGHTHSVHASTRRTPYSMQVALGLVREAEVDNSLHIGDVETTCYQVCRQQVIHISSLKLLNRLHSLLLGQVAVDFHCLKLEDLEEDQHPVTLHFLVEEYYDSLLE